MIRIETLLLAALMSSPVLYRTFVVGDTDVDTALITFLVAVPVAVLLTGLLRKVFRSYSRPAAVRPVPLVENGKRRREDPDQVVDAA